MLYASAPILRFEKGIKLGFLMAGVTLPDNFSNSSGETDTKRLAKPFYCKTPGLKTDANRFFNRISIL